MNVIPIEWILAKKYCEATGESLYTVQERIREGVWAAGLHYKRTGPRTLWIHLENVSKWITNQPHLESVCPLASKSEKENAVSVSA